MARLESHVVCHRHGALTHGRDRHGLERTPWRAVQSAAWAAMKKISDQRPGERTRVREPSKFSVLFHHHPPQLPQERVDIRGPSFLYSAINPHRDSLPTSFATSAVKDHVNVRVTGETLLQRLVHQRDTTPNNQQMSLVHIQSRS
jgi:hypothetical protein